MKKEKRVHTAEFKRQVVAMMERGDKPHTQLARELDLNTSLLHTWRAALRQEPAHAFPGHGCQAPEDDELTRLRREVAQLRKERDFLRAAAASFAQESPSLKSTPISTRSARTSRSR